MWDHRRSRERSMDGERLIKSERQTRWPNDRMSDRVEEYKRNSIEDGYDMPRGNNGSAAEVQGLTKRLESLESAIYMLSKQSATLVQLATIEANEKAKERDRIRIERELTQRRLVRNDTDIPKSNPDIRGETAPMSYRE